MAANDNGIDLSFEGANLIRTKAPFDPPGPPGTPKVTEYLPTQINISNLIEGRQYEFRVFTQNSAGLSPELKTSTSVKIVDPQVAKPPEIIQPLNKVNCVQNHNAHFQCKIIGTPRPTITWFKGAREIVSGSRYNIYSEGDTHNLIIHDVFGENADEYFCRAVNKCGVKSTKGELFIKTLLKLNVPPQFRDTAFFGKSANVVRKREVDQVYRKVLVWRLVLIFANYLQPQTVILQNVSEIKKLLIR
ncbi:myosin-binding protein H-like [Linepithema humile]|uniref:myosin-binding protein H-like n=1 Tax=Linepithema humile TaxID=83485 RepID=UPI00351ED8DA